MIADHYENLAEQLRKADALTLLRQLQNRDFSGITNITNTFLMILNDLLIRSRRVYLGKILLLKHMNSF